MTFCHRRAGRWRRLARLLAAVLVGTACTTTCTVASTVAAAAEDPGAPTTPPDASRDAPQDLLGSLTVGAPPPPIASYDIAATLEPASHQLRGTQTVRWRNASRSAVNELTFHLYLNAFRNSASVWLREAAPYEAAILAEQGWGWIELSRLTVDGADLLPALVYPGAAATAAAAAAATAVLGDDALSPAPGALDDRTVARLPLPAPVPPGGEIVLEIDFQAQLPPLVARTGFKNDFHLVAQWFPKLAALRPDGRWHDHPFHANSEFFADFGSYEVTLTLPQRFVVAATGVQVSEQLHDDGTRTLRFRQQGVHDFAWTAWPGFVEVAHTVERGALPPVEVTLLLRPETRYFTARYLAAVELGLRLFDAWYGPYPYRTLTVVDPPWGAEAAGGMEYPTLFTTGTRLHSPLATLEPEGLILHELAHQYWYGVVANDELEQPYLDEGLASYATARALEAAYPAAAWSYDLWGWQLTWPTVPWRPLVDEATAFFRRPTVDPVTRTSWGFLDRRAYGMLSYHKMALLLAQIERTVGSPAMERALHAYATEFRFGHPRVEDLERALSEQTGVDLEPWFSQLLDGSGRLDYAVTAVASRHRRGTVGIAGEGGERREVTDPEALDGYESTAVVRRLGEVRLPVMVELSFADGRRERRQWDGRERWIRYRTYGPRLVAAEVDPDFTMVLDANRLNNSLRARPDRRASRRWHQRVRFWIQNLLETAVTLA